MIVLRPKVSTLFSLALFISFCLVAGAIGVTHFVLGQALQWYDYLFLGLLLPLGLVLLFRMILNYALIRIGKNRLTVIYPTRFVERQYAIDQISYWTENQVKTPSGLFKEVEIRFNDGRKVSLSLQEHTGFADALAYLKKKCAKKYQEGK